MFLPFLISHLGMGVRTLSFLVLGVASVEESIQGLNLIHFRMWVLGWGLMPHRHLCHRTWQTLGRLVKFKVSSILTFLVTIFYQINNSPNNRSHSSSNMVNKGCNRSLPLTTPNKDSCSSSNSFNLLEEGWLVLGLSNWSHN